MNRAMLTPVFCVCLPACMMGADRAEEAPRVAAAELADKEAAMAYGNAGAAPSSPGAVRKAAKGLRARGQSALGGLLASESAADLEPEADDAPAAEAAPTRSWFPETFLFEPAVITDSAGEAALEVRVPDRLTTWRVLALAHSRAGGQAGAVTTFRSSLPLYVDPVLPAFLYVGDEVEVPVQVVNTTEQATRAALTVDVDDALATRLSGGGALTVPAGRSVLQPARLRADRPGTLTFAAGLRGADRVERTLPVRSTGRPVRFERGGTLGGTRKVAFALPEAAEPGATRVRLEVYPGALGLLRSELSVATGRRGVAEDAYTLLLAGRGPALLARLGAGEVNEEALRRLGLVASQRVLGHGRAPSAEDAALLAEAALAHPDNPVLARLGARLAAQVARAQRPDGTFGGGAGWTVRRLLVATAEGVAAVRAAAEDEASKRRADAAALRASGAFERYAGRVDDPYTAAWAVISGAAQGSLRDRFAKIVREAIVQGEDGARRLPCPKGAVRADGARPSDVECTAAAALALKGDEAASGWLPDLGAALVTAYRPSSGWGDGRTNLLALRAVTEIFDRPLPKQFRLQVRAGDAVLFDWQAEDGYADGPYATSRVVDGLSGDVEVVLRPEPTIPGMAFALTVDTHVPWDDAAQTRGLELEVDVAADARVGRPLDVTLRAVAPAGRRLEVRHALPAGVTPDEGSLSKLVLEGKLERFETEDGAVTLHLPKRDPGLAAVLTYRVVPTLRGRLFSGASKLEAAGATTWVPPARWVIR